MHFIVFFVSHVRCDTNGIGWKTCYQNCIESNIVSNNYCIPNPFTDKGFILHNSSNTLIKICKYTELKTRVCIKKCLKLCLQIYYETRIEDKGYNFDKNSDIRIQYRNAKNFEYKAIARIVFTELLSNIGGLFGLWFGLSFVDIYYVIKTLSINLKRILLKLMNTNFFRQIFRKFQQKFLKIIRNLILIMDSIERLQWKRLLAIISCPFFAVQIYNLLEDFLQYSTQISVEFIAYNKSEGKYSINEFPSITVCNEHNIRNYLFDDEYRNQINSTLEMFRKGYFANFECKRSKINTTLIYSFSPSVILYFLEYSMNLGCNYNPFNVNVSRSFLRNLDNFNMTLSTNLGTINLEMDFYDQHYICKNLIENMEITYCSKVQKISPYGKCVTYHGHSTDNSQLSYIDSFTLREHRPRMFNKDLERNYYMINKFFIHPSNTFIKSVDQEFHISDQSKHLSKLFMARIAKTQFQRLPEPYDTKCHEYYGSNQYECLNQCFGRKYLDQFGCIPISNSLYTFVLNGKLLFHLYFRGPLAMPDFLIE